MGNRALSRAIRKRLLDRNNQALRAAGVKYRVPAIDIARAVSVLARTLPGDLRDYDIDHIKPLVTCDLTTQQGVIEAFSSDNYRWLRKGRNRGRGTGDPGWP